MLRVPDGLLGRPDGQVGRQRGDRARRAGGAARALYDPVPAMMRELGSTGLVMSSATEEGPLLGTVRPVVLPPGRATLVLRGTAVERVQIAWTDPP